MIINYKVAKLYLLLYCVFDFVSLIIIIICDFNNIIVKVSSPSPELSFTE